MLGVAFSTGPRGTYIDPMHWILLVVAVLAALISGVMGFVLAFGKGSGDEGQINFALGCLFFCAGAVWFAVQQGTHVWSDIQRWGDEKCADCKVTEYQPQRDWYR